MAHALNTRHDFLHEHSVVLAASLALHLVLVVLLSLNLDIFPRRQPTPTRLAIQATVVDARVLREQAARAEQRQREQRQAEEQRRQRVLDRQREQTERRRAEQQRIADEREIAERRRQEQAEAQRRQEAQRQAEAAQARQAEAERERLAAEEARRKAASERRRAQTRADLARQIAEEEDLLAAEDSGLLDQYAEVIRQKVERNWIRPPSAREGISCAVLVKQIPGGEVVDVRVAECNGDAAVVRSIEAAVLRASPLPPPPDPSLFDRSLRFDFRPRD